VQIDLVFVEYALNDGFIDSTVSNPRVRVMERLVRRLLSKPHYPAIMFMQVPSHGQAFRRDKGDFRGFHITPEDQYGALALYYDLHWLSMRQAYLNRLGSGEGAAAEVGNGMQYMDHDGFHPNDLGHKMMADVAVWAVQTAAVGLALRPLGLEEVAYLERRSLPQPMHQGKILSACYRLLFLHARVILLAHPHSCLDPHRRIF